MSLGNLIDKLEDNAPAVDLPHTIAKLATNKDIRIFLTALARYPQAKFDDMMRDFKIFYQGIQQSALRKDDAVIRELAKYPHIAAFIVRITED
jgi:hypothetical protein